MESLFRSLLSKGALSNMAREVMSKMKVPPFDLYFVVNQQPGTEEYDFLGMTYTPEAAQELIGKPYDGQHIHVLRMDMAHALKVMKELGIVVDVRV